MPKTLAFRFDDDLHQQLSIVAQLEDTTITDLVRQAINAMLESKRADGSLAARAEAVLADIEREAASRRDAIATLMGPKAKPTTGKPKSPAGS